MNQKPHQASADSQALFRLLRVTYAAMFASVGAYWLVGEMLVGQIETSAPASVVRVLQAAAAVTVLLVLVLRFQRIAALSATAPPPATAALLARLRVLYLVCFALAEAVALYGLVLRFLGASRADVTLFFLAAAVLFLLCYPRPPTAR